MSQEQTDFAAWEGQLRSLIAAANRDVADIAAALRRCPGPVTEGEARELLRFRESLALKPWPLPPPGVEPQDHAKRLFDRLSSAVLSLAAPLGELLVAADRALLAQAEAGNEVLLCPEHFGTEGVRIVDWSPRVVPYAVGIRTRLPAGHHGYRLVDEGDRYRWNGAPVLILGDARPVTDLQAKRSWRPQPWYSADSVRELTRKLSAEQRAEEESRCLGAELLAEQQARQAEAARQADPAVRLAQFERELAALKAQRE
jgi:hypothetical protein